MTFADSISHTVVYLTEPLAGYYPPTTLIKLQAALQISFAASLSATWEPPSQQPLCRSATRVFSFTPGAAPPQPIQQACLVAGVKWHEWSTLLEYSDFDLIIEPRYVSIYVASTSASPPGCLVIWSEEQNLRARAGAQLIRTLQKAPPVVNVAGTATTHTVAEGVVMSTARMPATAVPKTLAQRLLEEDDEGTEEVFSLLNDAMLEHAKAPVGPALLGVPDWPCSVGGGLGHHSRSSSLESMVSYGSGCSSSVESSSASSVCDDGTSSCSSNPQSRRKRSRNRCDVFVDSSKTDVTPYDGGKTTVLTGGVMLGVRQNRSDQRRRH